MLLYNVAFAILSLSCFVKGEEGDPVFRRDFTYIKDLNAFYKYDRILRKWSDALAYCKARDAELFIPKSQKEIDEVLNLYSEGYVWVAAHDIFSEGNFVSVDGKALSEYYVKWLPGEPNNSNNNEDCALMNRDGKCGDVPCDHEHQTVCRKIAQNLTQNLICETHDLEYAYTSQTDRCYKFHSTPKNWHQAYGICSGENAQLVVINGDAEAKILSLMFAKYPERSLRGNFDKDNLLVGFSDLLNHGDYVTIEGESLRKAGYEHWSQSQPDNKGNNEHCGSMLRDGTLNDIDCLKRAMFVCEKKLSNSGGNGLLEKLPDEQ